MKSLTIIIILLGLTLSFAKVTKHQTANLVQIKEDDDKKEKEKEKEDENVLDKAEKAKDDVKDGVKAAVDGDHLAFEEDDGRKLHGFFRTLNSILKRALAIKDDIEIPKTPEGKEKTTVQLKKKNARDQLDQVKKLQSDKNEISVIEADLKALVEKGKIQAKLADEKHKKVSQDTAASFQTLIDHLNDALEKFIGFSDKADIEGDIVVLQTDVEEKSATEEVEAFKTGLADSEKVAETLKETLKKELELEDEDDDEEGVCSIGCGTCHLYLILFIVFLLTTIGLLVFILFFNDKNKGADDQQKKQGGDYEKVPQNDKEVNK